MQDLKKWFSKAKLILKLMKNPIRNINREVLQLTITTKGSKRKREIFRLYRGNEDNDVRVIDVDPNTQQLILLVNEPPREFTTLEWNKKTNKSEKVKRTTPGFTRKYLLGMDEAHLFISELPQEGAINKIKDAHKVLKPEYIVKSEKETRRIKRQGEWFFIPVTSEEQKMIEENMNFLEKKFPIEDRPIHIYLPANPHIAEQLLKIKEEIFVTGKIKHVEHRTLKLNGWFKVLRNTEVRTRSRIIGWID